MKKKIIALAVAAALLAIAVVGGTFAYFTAEDEATNVFTVGSVDIDLIESQYHRTGAFGDGVAKTDEDIIEDAKTYDAYLAEQGENIVPGRVIMKNPYVVNTGKSAAYVRVRVMIDADLLDVIDITFTQTAIDDGSVIMNVSEADANGMVTASFIYTEALAPANEDGNMTYWSPISNFKIPANLDNTDVAAFQNINNYIYVEADAIQAEGFADAVEAFAAFDAQN